MLERIKDFTPQEGIWRIDSLGCLTRNDNLTSFDEPKIKITLFRLNGPPDEVNPISLGSSDHQNAIQRYYPLSLLPSLKHGDYWSNGRPVERRKRPSPMTFLINEQDRAAAKTLMMGEPIPEDERFRFGPAFHYLIIQARIINVHGG